MTLNGQPLVLVSPLMLNAILEYLFFQAISDQVYHNQKEKILYSNGSEFWEKARKLKTIWVFLHLPFRYNIIYSFVLILFSI